MSLLHYGARCDVLVAHVPVGGESGSTDLRKVVRAFGVFLKVFRAFGAQNSVPTDS